MFGKDDDQQTTVGAPVVQDPTMLDNVSSNDFVGTDTTATPVQTDSNAPDDVNVPEIDNVVPEINNSSDSSAEHQISSDNPFNPTPANSHMAGGGPTLASALPGADLGSDTTNSSVDDASPPEAAHDATPTSHSGPVQPPVDETQGANTTPTNPPHVEEAAPQDNPIASSDEAGGHADSSSSVPDIDPEKLAGMKKQALDHLEPLVNKLEQDPEETFKTTMMMIQANDNHTLLDKALESAKNIKDDKERARAMLDIINEINYFSQPHSDDNQDS